MSKSNSSSKSEKIRIQFCLTEKFSQGRQEILTEKWKHFKKIVLPGQVISYALCAVRASDERGRSLPDRFREGKGAHRSCVEAGRGRQVQVELGVPRGIGVVRFFPKKSGIPYYQITGA